MSSYRNILYILPFFYFITGCTFIECDSLPGTITGENKTARIDSIGLDLFSSSEPKSLEQAEQKVKNQLELRSDDTIEEIKLSLDEIRKDALENNLGLKVDLMSSEIVRTYSDQERAKFEMVFFGSAGVLNDNYNNHEDISYNLGISKPLPTGGEFSIEFPYHKNAYEGYNADRTASASVSYSQSLLRGAGLEYNTGSIKVACINNVIADADTKLSVINLVALADISYWRLYSAFMSLEIRREQYRLALEQLDQVKKKVAAGAAASMEIVRAQAAVSGRLESVINAESLVATRYRNLQQIIKPNELSISDSIDVLPTTLPDPVKYEIDHNVIVEYAQENRMDVLKLVKQIDIDKIFIDVAENETLPRVNLSSSYKMHGSGESSSKSISNLADSSSTSFYTGLSLSVPIGNKSAKAKLNRMKLQHQQHNASLEELKQLIAYDVRNAVADIDSSWRRILAARHGVESALLNYKVEQSQFQLGQRVSTDVSFAATKLADSQISQTNAFVDYEIAQIRLALATGTVLGQSNIVIGNENRISMQ